MSIRRSAAPEIRALVDALASPDDVRRESAIARLAIIGERAVDRLVAAYAAADRPTRIAILRAAEAIADPRVIPMSVEALRAGGDLAAAGAATLRALLDSSLDTASSQALDALVATALDRTLDRHVRLAAFDALRDLPATVRDPVAHLLQQDPDAGLKALASERPHDAGAADAAWQDALDGRVPDDPGTLQDAVRLRAGSAPLIALQKLVDAVRVREADASGERRAGWRQVRGSLHQALALRGSRVAVYDLRETVEHTRGPLPPSFLAALHVVGDETCLEPLAAAWTATAEAGWRHQVEATVHAIVQREKISRRGALWKRLRARYPALIGRFDPPAR